MDVADLMKELVALYPNQFRQPGTIEAWASQYRNALGRLSSDELEKAWRSTMAGWQKSYFPKPADIAAYAPHDAGAKSVAERYELTKRWPHEIMKSVYGQRAIENDVAHSLYLWAEENPAEHPTDKTISELVRDREKLAGTMFHVKQHPGEYTAGAVLLTIYGRMLDRELEYANRYRTATPTPALGGDAPDLGF